MSATSVTLVNVTSSHLREGMSLRAFFLVLGATWCTIHISYYLSKHRSRSLLPGLTPVRPDSFFGTSRVTLNGLHFRISTTKWNAHHDKVIAFFARRRNRKVTTLLITMYNFGILLGTLSMIFVILFCLTSVWRGIAERPVAGGSGVPTSNLFKRLAEDTSGYQPSILSSSGQSPIITPVIPGVTVPLCHLPIILVAVFIAQLIHELGHVAAAAIEALPMTAAGASFTVCIPAAFVTFSSLGTNNLRREARARVIAAGPFHNFAFWCLLALLIRLGIANLSILIAGYKNVSAIGKAIVDVKTDSPLFLRLNPGSIVTQLDEASLSSTAGRDEWSNYLNLMERVPSPFGWCVNRNTFVTLDPCCDAPSSPKNSSLTCFISLSGSSEQTQGCIDPLAVFTIPSRDRCSATAECATGSLCITPHQDSQLLRLKVRAQALDDRETLVLWSGPWREVFEEVQVSNWLPRSRFLPLQAPLVIQNFWEYLSMATLSLYLFNLLPLPYLDGTELCKELIDMAFEDRGDAFAYDIESLDYRSGDPNRGGKWRKRVMKLIHSAVAVILTAYVLLALMNARL